MAYFFIFAAVILRLIPHLPNFAPISAMALFGGTYLGKRYAILVPLAARILSDILIGFDRWQIMFFVYLSHALVGLLGIYISTRKTLNNIVGAALLGSVLFFLITNFAVWVWSGMYPHTANGLRDAYLLAIPFFRNTILGDLFYTGVLFGGYELAQYAVRKYLLRKAKVLIKVQRA